MPEEFEIDDDIKGPIDVAPSEAVAKWRERRSFVKHPDAERFDAITIETIERWKESELSGDEWRFSHIVKFWRHGRAVAQCSAGSIEEAALVAAYQFNRVTAVPEGQPFMGDLSEVCCQPACPNPWVVLMHPIKRYSERGDEMARPYNEGEVRGFCERHRMRGDCGLDDADVNYVLVEERFPPDWSTDQEAP